jgi:hypothetical protein
VTTFFLFLLWGFCITLALFGYGRLVMRLLPCEGNGSWLIAPAPGLACVVLLGALLNLSGMIQGPLVVAGILAGVLLFLLDLFRNMRRIAHPLSSVGFAEKPSYLTALGAIPVFAILATRLCAYVLTNPVLFNYHDDDQAYLAFPLKMLQTGSFAADPFSERRIVSSLGGGTFLQAVSIAPFSDLRIINLVDGTIGYFLLILFCIALCRLLKLPAKFTWAILFVLALTPDYRVNVSSIVLPGALLLAVAVIHLDNEWGTRLSLQKSLLIGMVAGTACTLKSTIITSFVIFIAVMLLLDLRSLGLRRVAQAGAVIAGTAGLVLLPWMIDSAMKCGTPLYPLLGHGYHSTSYSYPALSVGIPLRDRLLDWPLLAALVFFIFAFAIFKAQNLPADGRKESLLAGLITAGTTVLLFQYVAAGVSPRFSMTTLLPVNALVLAILFAPGLHHEPDSRRLTITGYLYTAFALITAVLVFRSFATGNVAYYARVVKKDLFVRSHAIPDASLIATDHAIQDSIPIGSTLLARTDQSYGYDFERNRLWIADFPGSASLPPGMPMNSDPASLKEYLLQHSIRYIAYSYADYSNFPPALCQERTSTEFWRTIPIEAREATAACMIQDNFAQLGAKQTHLYDDGNVYVLDLAQPMN